MKKVLIILFSLILIGGISWYFYAKNTKSQGGVPSLSDFGSFLPIGKNVDPNIPGTIAQPGVDPNGTSDNTLTLSPYKQISPHPISDYVIYDVTVPVIIPADPKDPKSKPTTQNVVKNMLRYVARSSGYVYEIEENEIPLQVSNVYIPNIYESVFGDKSNTAILRFLRNDQRTIASYSVPVPPANSDGTRTQREGVYFGDNITTMAASPDGSQVASIKGDGAGALLSISTPSNLKRVDILRTPFKEWIISWPSPKTIYLQTKASAQVPGFLYKVDTTEKKLRRVLGNINGLTTSVSPSGNYILYSQNSGAGFVTKILNTKTNTTTSFTLALLPEKCAWLKNEDLICAGNTSLEEASYPDDWYMGKISFTDQVYKIYTSSSLYDRLNDVNPNSFDMTKLSINEKNSELYFTDKKTGLLWRFSY